MRSDPTSNRNPNPTSNLNANSNRTHFACSVFIFHTFKLSHFTRGRRNSFAVRVHRADLRRSTNCNIMTTRRRSWLVARSAVRTVATPLFIADAGT